MRPAKSTPSIIEKLKRESIRLSQMQDIAGCRLIVDNVMAQESLADAVMRLFPGAQKIDRRSNPSHGYRAIHLMVKPADRAVEIQIRTELQHLWAQLSERYADTFGSAIKYGGGDESVREMLERQSMLVSFQEMLDAETRRRQSLGTTDRPAQTDVDKELAELRLQLRSSLLQLIDRIDGAT